MTAIDQTMDGARRAANVAAIYTDADIKVPKTLADALAAWDAAYAYDPTTDRPDLARAALDIKPAAAAELIESVARHDAVVADRTKARGELLTALSRRTHRAAVEAGPAAIELLGPRFDAAAEQFTTVYRTIPRRLIENDIELHPGELLRAGSAVVATVEAADVAYAELRAIERLRDELARMGIRAKVPSEYDQWTRYCAPATRTDCEVLRFAQPELQRWRPFADFLERGHELAWQTFADQEALAARYQAEPATRAPRIPSQRHAWV